MRPPDPRFRYAVRYDAENERGEEGAWERYLRAAELAVRPQEEWELERARPHSGDHFYVRGYVTYQALSALKSRAAQAEFMSTLILAAVETLVLGGVDRATTTFRTQHAQDRNAIEYVVHGTVG